MPTPGQSYQSYSFTYFLHPILCMTFSSPILLPPYTPRGHLHQPTNLPSWLFGRGRKLVHHTVTWKLANSTQPAPKARLKLGLLKLWRSSVNCWTQVPLELVSRGLLHCETPLLAAEVSVEWKVLRMPWTTQNGLTLRTRGRRTADLITCVLYKAVRRNHLTDMCYSMAPFVKITPSNID